MDAVRTIKGPFSRSPREPRGSTNTYHLVQVRVLHPLLGPDRFTPILRGLPEGIRLSPTLFSILISKSPRELQSMINTCQAWCEKSRVEINIDKTKIMTFNTHLHPAHRQSSHTWSITFHFLPHDHPQKSAILKVVDSFKYLGVPIDKDLSMSTLHTLILNNIQKANGKLHGLLRDLKSNRELHSSHQSTLGRASTSPKTIGLVWKSCVLVHATQYLRYIHSHTQLEKIQTELNKSLQSVFGCVGLPSTLQADLGIPPLMFYQTKQLACSHFRLTNLHKHSIPGQIYAFRTHNLRHLKQTDLENRIIRGCQTVFTEWSPPEPLPQPKYLERSVNSESGEVLRKISPRSSLKHLADATAAPTPPHGAYSA
jgi:hypothetical protein